MRKYETDLLENPLVIAAVYIDPRYQRILNAEKKETAFTILKNIHHEIEMLSSLTEPTSTEDSNNDKNNSNSFEELMQYIDSLSNNEQASANDINRIDEAIRRFDGNCTQRIFLVCNIGKARKWMNQHYIY